MKSNNHSKRHALLLLVVSFFVAATAYGQGMFKQEYAVKYYFEGEQPGSMKVLSDRNQRVQVLQSNHLWKPVQGSLLFPGILRPDVSYRYDSLEHIQDMLVNQQELVYLTDKAVYSNAWAGALYFHHQLPKARLFSADDAMNFLVTDGGAIHLYSSQGKQLWKGEVAGTVKAIRYDRRHHIFWLLDEKRIWVLPIQNPGLQEVFTGTAFTCFELLEQKNELILGTEEGYAQLKIREGKNSAIIGLQEAVWNRNLPVNKLTVVQQVSGELWFGSGKGAFKLNTDGKFEYYQSKRWLPNDVVYAIAEGPDSTVLIGTEHGLAQLYTKHITLKEKAKYYEQQVRERHIRYGFNATLKGLQGGHLDKGTLSDSDNDGLWTSMYLAAEAFRYAVDKDPVALVNCRESLLAMERLYSVNPLKGFPSRSFERIGHKTDLADSKVWMDAPDNLWSWKSTTSSDEAIGHIFSFSVLAELVDDAFIKAKAISLMDSLMSHILEHNLYLVDHDGKPTLWGRWNPEYVNQFPTNVGDRKLNSSNIISMLQSAYHFTHKAKYKDKALELMERYGYYENLMRPMREIGKADEHADDKSKLLSDHWNHSDDEMYFLGYWGLYRYALNDTLKAGYQKAILDHWEFERPEKEALWNMFAAMVGAKDSDLKASLSFLEEFPLDLMNWRIQNSHRKDLYFLTDNFMNQTTKQVLSPKERPVHRHNRTTFLLDEERDGTEEFSAGDIWLLPYWFGRYLGLVD